MKRRPSHLAKEEKLRQWFPACLSGVWHQPTCVCPLCSIRLCSCFSTSCVLSLHDRHGNSHFTPSIVNTKFGTANLFWAFIQEGTAGIPEEKRHLLAPPSPQSLSFARYQARLFIWFITKFARDRDVAGTASPMRRMSTFRRWYFRWVMEWDSPQEWAYVESARQSCLCASVLGKWGERPSVLSMHIHGELQKFPKKSFV